MHDMRYLHVELTLEYFDKKMDEKVRYLVTSNGLPSSPYRSFPKRIINA